MTILHRAIAMRATIIPLLAALFLISFQATQANAQRMSTRYSDQELMDILRREGYNSVSLIRKNIIRIKIDGRSFVLFNKKDGDLQLYYGITGVKISYRTINEWNRTKRLSKAYIDNEGDPVIETDLLANAGMTPKHVTEFLRIFLQSVSLYRKFIRENNGK